MENAMRGAGESSVPTMMTDLDRVNQDLDIMERHGAAMEQVESEVKDAIRKWDREYKNSCLHSVPRPRKHMR